MEIAAGMVKHLSHSGQAISEIVESEVLIIRHSGEIPEVAFHGSLYYLHEDPEGPCFKIIPHELRSAMVKAVVERYKFITLRDLNPKNRNKRIYRGPLRSIVNWHRLKKFAEQEGVDISGFKREVADALHLFLQREIDDRCAGIETGAINCSFDELCEFSTETGGTLPDRLELLREICPVDVD